MHKSKMMLAAMSCVHPYILSAIPEPKPTPKKLFLHADQERLDKAQAKRDRKAKRRATQDHDQGGTMTNKAERLQRYLDRLKVARGFDKEHIHVFDAGEPAEAFLLASDIQAAIDRIAQLEAERAAIEALIEESSHGISSLDATEFYSDLLQAIRARSTGGGK